MFLASSLLVVAWLSNNPATAPARGPTGTHRNGGHAAMARHAAGRDPQEPNG
ncbi:MAG: hypothetical protein HZY76_05960 [Anaerolineae bacterium]|nr:MAG: hypothetical protein HZY76_05960 [Anaerolineae bacterium]